MSLFFPSTSVGRAHGASLLWAYFKYASIYSTWLMRLFLLLLLFNLFFFFTSFKHLTSHRPKQELWKRVSTAVTCVHFYNQVSLFLLWQWWSKLPRTCVTIVTGLYSCSAVLFEFDEVPVVILQIWPCPQPPRGGNWMMLNVSGYVFYFPFYILSSWYDRPGWPSSFLNILTFFFIVLFFLIL